MKKLIFLISLIALMAVLCLAVSAKDYAPTTGAELNDAINEAQTLNEASTFTLNGDYTDYSVSAGYQINYGSNFTFNLTGDVIVKCRFYITGSVVVNLNGHTIQNTASRGGLEGSMFCVDKTSDNNKGSLEVYNGTLTISDVCVAFQYGSLKLHDVTIKANEEPIWVSAQGCEGGGRTYMIDNCTFSGKDGTNLYCLDENSYVKNLTVLNGTLIVDSWHRHGELKSGAVLENIDATAVTTKILTGANNFTFVNCDFGAITVQGDRNGAGTHYFYDCTYTSLTPTDNKEVNAHVYTSPDCENPGTLKLYTLEDKNGTLDASYSEENPKLGHIFDENNVTGLIYESYLENGFYSSVCGRCKSGEATETVPSAQPLFISLGVSVPENGSFGLVSSYAVNVKGIEQYEKLTGKTVEYGIVAAAKANLGSNNPLDKDGNAVALEKGDVVRAEITREYAAYDFILKGLGENQLDTEIVIASYVKITKVEGEETNTSVVYIQDTQKTENLSATTYNLEK